MKLSILLAAGAVSLAAALAAQAADAPKTQTICLASGGQQRPATCHGYGGGSRLAAQDEVCTCPGAAQMVKAPTCAAGETPPSESAAYEQARLKAISHGSLEGATWQGKSMCVNPTTRN
ncbi:hypothetical protein [Phenylobacterium sp.]|jgi:uncharacterized membrane protein|uniref:hypothetical protein n=1 Tax=Phenylobacterium sp. TaxID=1871053 RepID=UPI002F3EBCEE